MYHHYDVVSFALFEQRNIELSEKKQCNLGKSPTLLLKVYILRPFTCINHIKSVMYGGNRTNNLRAWEQHNRITLIILRDLITLCMRYTFMCARISIHSMNCYIRCETTSRLCVHECLSRGTEE